MRMKILVTGAAGFLGTRVIRALLEGPDGLPAVSQIVAVDVFPTPVQDRRVERRIGTIVDPGFVQSIVDSDVGIVYHLAAVLSGQSEAEFDTGMRVNLDGTRALLGVCRNIQARPRFIFSSTVAVFGGELPAVVPEDIALQPQTSYGAAKAIAELLVAEYSRRGYVDGIACRLPTITVRPGRPNSALSSFVSGIIREPLSGVESICPVALDTPIWVSSPGAVTQNLVHAARIDTARLGYRRAVNMPGITVTPRQMLDSLERLGGREARARVRCEQDEHVNRAMCGWPGALDASRALGLGFVADSNVDELVQQFIRDRVSDPARHASGTPT
jgi:D-erythronate 2-dehydrogenase